MIRRVSQSPRTWFAIPALSVLIFNVGCASLSPTPALAAEAEQPGYEATYFESALLLESREYGQVIERLTPLRTDANCPPEIMIALAEAHLRSGSEDEGRAVVDELITRHPDFIPGLRLRSTISRLKSDYDAAIADIEAALLLEPKNSEMLEELGLLRYRTLEKRMREKGQETALLELVDIYERIGDLKQGSQKIPSLLIISGIYSEMGQHEKAIQYASQAVALRPQNVRGQIALAEAYSKAQQPKEALRSYRQALLIEPENASIRAKVAEMVSAQGGAEGLLAFYEELAESFPRLKEIQKLYGDELIRANEWKKAADHFKSYLEQWPDETDAKSTLVVVNFMLGRDKEAMALADALIKDKNFSPRELTNLAQMLTRGGKLDAAADLYKKISESDPANDQILLALAGVQIETGKQKDAIETLERLVERRPDLFLGAAMLGQLYAEEGRFDDAHKVYDRVQSAVPDENKTELLVHKADLYRRERKPEEARKILEQIEASDTPLPEAAVRMLVEIYANEGNFEKAHGALDKQIAVATGDQVSAWQNVKAWIYWRERRYKDAIAVLEGLHAADPDNFQVVEFLAENYAEVGEMDKAQGLLKAAEATLVGESKDDLLLLRARLYNKAKQHGEAVAIIEAVLKRHQDDPRLMLEAGQYYHEAGRIDEAERVLRRAIELNPADAEAYNALGYFFAEANVKLDEAEKLVQKALELNPNAGHILDSLGWVFYRQGKFAKAIETLEKAVERLSATPDAVIYDHLGDAYAKDGRTEDARRYWGEALKLDPDSEAIRKKLGK